jgi:hypothetical protein
MVPDVLRATYLPLELLGDPCPGTNLYEYDCAIYLLRTTYSLPSLICVEATGEMIDTKYLYKDTGHSTLTLPSNSYSVEWSIQLHPVGTPKLPI